MEVYLTWQFWYQVLSAFAFHRHRRQVRKNQVSAHTPEPDTCGEDIEAV